MTVFDYRTPAPRRVTWVELASMIERPVLIIGCPRSGTTLLYNILSEVSGLWSIGRESKHIIERHHHPRTKGWVSGALEAGDLTPESARWIIGAFERQAAPAGFWRRVNRLRGWLRRRAAWRALKRRGRGNAAGAALAGAVPVGGMELVGRLVACRNGLLPRRAATPMRLLEKTPENCLRLPFLLALFPDARVIHLSRDAPANISSLMEGWRQQRLFPGYRVPEPVAIPGDRRGRWAFTLIPGWRELLSSPLEEVCAWQWVRSNEAVLAHLDATAGAVPHLRLRYEELVADPPVVLREIAGFLEVDYVAELSRHAERLPEVNVVSAPGREKWRRHADPIARVRPIFGPLRERLGYRGDSFS